MINEQKLREKLGEILERPAYRGLYTYSREPLIGMVIKAVKECEVTEPEAVAEEETVEEAATVEEPEPEKQKKKRSW